MRFFAVVLLVVAVVGFTGCGSEPVAIAPDPKISLPISADGTIEHAIPAGSTQAPVNSGIASDEDEDED